MGILGAFAGVELEPVQALPKGFGALVPWDSDGKFDVVPEEEGPWAPGTTRGWMVALAWVKGTGAEDEEAP